MVYVSMRIPEHVVSGFSGLLLNQNKGSFCSCGLWGPYVWPAIMCFIEPNIALSRPAPPPNKKVRVIRSFSYLVGSVWLGLVLGLIINGRIDGVGPLVKEQTIGPFNFKEAV